MRNLVGFLNRIINAAIAKHNKDVNPELAKKGKGCECSDSDSDDDEQGVYAYQVHNFVKDDPEYLGISDLDSINDFIDEIPTDDNSYIIILDKEHYTVLYIDTDLKSIMYYDSLARGIPKEIQDAVFKIYKHLQDNGEIVHYKFKFNQNKIQNEDDPNCALYVLDFINTYQDTGNFQKAS